MAHFDGSAGPRYSFENDLTGQLFRWLIESGEVDFRTMIDSAVQGDPDPQSWVKPLAKGLKDKVGKDWVPQRPSGNPPEGAPALPTAPPYTIWFRPSPSKKIKFKEVARAILVFTGRVPPPAG